MESSLQPNTATADEPPSHTPDANLDPQAMPTSRRDFRLNRTIAITLALFHLLALAAAVPWLFSWSGLVLMLLGIYAFGTLGMNVCYHRLLTHRSFKTPRWLERVLTVLAVCSCQGSPIGWVAAHRMHHQHSDEPPDPHSPIVSFLWSHVGWVVLDNPAVKSRSAYARYAADLCRDPFHWKLEHKLDWVKIWMLHIALFPLAGFLVGWAMTGAWMGGVQLGLSWLVWGVLVRTVLVWHITWSVNSVTHLWGYRNYKTHDDSQNNVLVGIVSMGEGWHNNHHADQRAAAHGHKWWEVDVTYLTIRLLGLLGLARDTVHPKRNVGTKHEPARE